MTPDRPTLRLPSLNSFNIRRKKHSGKPLTPADSGCPSPVVRWQSEQARGSSRRPFATTGGIGGWSPGYQSGGPYGLLISTSLYFLSLPGCVTILAGSRLGAPFGATG